MAFSAWIRELNSVCFFLNAELLPLFLSCFWCCRACMKAHFVSGPERTGGKETERQAWSYPHLTEWHTSWNIKALVFMCLNVLTLITVRRWPADIILPLLMLQASFCAVLYLDFSQGWFRAKGPQGSNASLYIQG